MLTKEELLEKGVDSDVADQIIASYEESNESADPIEALEKAVSEPAMEELTKADDDGEPEEDDKGYDESYMKKHMKKFMINNKKMCKKMATEVGVFGEKMNKAIDDIDIESQGAVVEMEDLKPFLDAQKDFNEKMSKAIDILSGQIAFISDQNEKSYDVLMKSGAVLVEQSKSVDAFLSKPQGRKSAPVNMEKASEVETSSINKDQSKVIYETLLKAVKNGDKVAGQMISVLESVGNDANVFNQDERKYVHDLIKKEAK